MDALMMWRAWWVAPDVDDQLRADFWEAVAEFMATEAAS